MRVFGITRQAGKNFQSERVSKRGASSGCVGEKVSSLQLHPMSQHSKSEIDQCENHKDVMFRQ